MLFFATFHVSVGARILSEWVNLIEVGKLEIAMCSSDNRLQLMSVLEHCVFAYDTSICEDYAEMTLGWLVVHKVKVSILNLVNPLSRSTNTLLLSLISNSKSHIAEVHIDDNNLITHTVVAGLTMNCVNLEWLELRNCEVDLSIRVLFLTAKRLAKVGLQNCQGLVVPLFEDITCGSINHLYVAEPISDEPLAAMLKMCSHLKYFFSYQSTGRVSAVPSTLNHLRIVHCPVTLNCYAQHVCTMDLLRCNLSDATLQASIRSAPNLTCLNVWGNKQLTGTGWLDQNGLLAQKLCILKLNGCINMRADILMIFVKQCKMLRQLCISHITTMPTNICAELLRDCTTLRTLKVNGVHLSDESMCVVANSCLEKLEMYESDGFSNEGLCALVLNGKSLREVSINSAHKTEPVTMLWSKLQPALRFVPPALPW